MKFKKVLRPLIAGALAFSLAACSGDDKAKNNETPDTTQGETVSAEEMQAKLAEQQVEKDKVVAVVNDEDLVGEQYNAVLSAIHNQILQAGQDPTRKEVIENIKDQVLDALVNQALVLQKAKEVKITAAEAEIEEYFVSYSEQFTDEETMNEELKNQNTDVETIKEKIAELIVFEKYQDQVAPVEKVTDEEIKEYYDQVAAQGKESGQELELPSLEEVSEDIKRILEQEQQQKQLGTHLEEIKADAKIELKI